MVVTIVPSPLLETVQKRPDAPFGTLFLGVMVEDTMTFPPNGKNSTSNSEETSQDGKSKLDPVYDDDEDEDRAEHEILCLQPGGGTLADLLA